MLYLINKLSALANMAKLRLVENFILILISL